MVQLLRELLLRRDSNRKVKRCSEPFVALTLNAVIRTPELPSSRMTYEYRASEPYKNNAS